MPANAHSPLAQNILRVTFEKDIVDTLSDPGLRPREGMNKLTLKKFVKDADRAEYWDVFDIAIAELIHSNKIIAGNGKYYAKKYAPGNASRAKPSSPAKPKPSARPNASPAKIKPPNSVELAAPAAPSSPAAPSPPVLPKDPPATADGSSGAIWMFVGAAILAAAVAYGYSM